MKSRLILISCSIFLCTVILFGCRSDKGEKTNVNNNAQEENNEQVVIQNHDELKIDISGEANQIKDQVTFTNIKKKVENNITTISGIVNNGTNQVITPYMNLMFYDKSDKLILTANTFADKVPANGSKEFLANVIGDYTSYDLKIELAQLE